VRPYALTDHIHERESSRHLATLLSGESEAREPFSISFIPNVAPWFSGILSVLNAPLKQTMRANEVYELYEEKYGKEPMLSVGKAVPDVVRDVEGRHGWKMGGVQVHSGGKRVVVVVSRRERAAGGQPGLDWKTKTSAETNRADWTTCSKAPRRSVCRI
jgi:N-acetyl-gamma-glutamyl-phosphate reductase/acetylglutamate kinase